MTIGCLDILLDMFQLPISMDLASVFSEMVGAEATLWFHVELRKDNRVHTWYLSHFLITNEERASFQGKADPWDSLS